MERRYLKLMIVQKLYKKVPLVLLAGALAAGHEVIKVKKVIKGKSYKGKK